MKKIVLLFTIILLSVFVSNFVSALDKPILNISNCYNLSVSVDLFDGNITPISFSGCSKVDDNNFVCNCYSSDNKNYTLIMQTDGAIIRNERNYRVHVVANVYHFATKKTSFDVVDWGDYVDLGDHQVDDLGDNYRIITEYVNHTVVQVVNNTIVKDRIVEVVKVVNQTIENTSRVDLCLASNIFKDEQIGYLSNVTAGTRLLYDYEVRQNHIMGYVIGVLLALVVMFIIYFFIKNNKKLKEVQQ